MDRNGNRLTLTAGIAVCGVAIPALAGEPTLPAVKGPFVPTVESLENYQCPAWFRDAKFGICDEGKTGLRLFAYLYNRNMAWHEGRLEGVMTHKGNKGPKRAPYWENIVTLDKEHNMSGEIRERAWQTDDSIGPWGYNATSDYKDANAVIDKMIDTVAKNGNYLLNVPPRADGSLDEATAAR